MSGLFNKPEVQKVDNGYGVDVLFLHGLEGSTVGSKAKHLQQKWGAACPPMRTEDLVAKRDDCDGNWSLLDQSEKDAGLSLAYADAVSAVRYSKPDVIVGSSMGGAILFKMIAEDRYNGAAVFCAPAISNLLDTQVISRGVERLKSMPNVWILGELDTVVENGHNLTTARAAGGSIIYSAEDDHRLSKAVNTGLLNSAVLTSVELLSARSILGL